MMKAKVVAVISNFNSISTEFKAENIKTDPKWYFMFKTKYWICINFTKDW